MFGGAGSIVVVLGKTEEGPYSKSLALHVRRSPLLPYTCLGMLMMFDQFWLLGYEFPATLFLLTPEKFYVVTTAKKGVSMSPKSYYIRLVLIGMLGVGSEASGGAERWQSSGRVFYSGERCGPECEAVCRYCRSYEEARSR